MRSSAQVSGARARNHEVDASGNRLLEPQPESQEFFQNDPQNPKKKPTFSHEELTRNHHFPFKLKN
jgi:hypothetical protein